MRWTDIVERRSGDVVMLDVRGTMTLSVPPGGVASLLNRLVQQGDCNILVNLRQVPYIDSQGLADLIDGFKTARGAGGALSCVRSPKAFRSC